MEEKKNGFIKQHEELWKFVKFCFAGVVSFGIQYLVDIFFHYVVFKGLQGQTVDNSVFRFLGIDSQMDAAYAYFIAAAVGYTISFILNRKVTFDSNSGLTTSFIMYIVMVVATVFIAAWMKGAFTALVASWGYENKISDLIIFVLVTTIPFLWTYPLQRFVIMKKKTPEE
ncbi:MAG: GtrA family protein [Eubacterium sp.]|nr:GtrA family protein [Eubacterium sp.]